MPKGAETPAGTREQTRLRPGTDECQAQGQIPGPRPGPSQMPVEALRLTRTCPTFDQCGCKDLTSDGFDQ